MQESEIFEKLLKRPESYRSLLKGSYGRNTTTVVLRRKLLRAVRNGKLGRVCLNGTRGGECLFYIIPKKYNIVIISEHRDFKYYVCDKVKKIDKATICLMNVSELVDNEWKYLGDNICLFIGNVVKLS